MCLIRKITTPFDSAVSITPDAVIAEEVVELTKLMWLLSYRLDTDFERIISILT
jgi:hypothetical protein